MEFFKETFLYKKSNVNASSSLLCFEGAHSFKVFKKEKGGDVKSLVKNINVALFEKEKRIESLSLLLLILPQCDNGIFNEYGEKWFKLCAQAINHPARTCEKISLLKIMTFILKKSSELKELHTKIAKLNNSIFLLYLCSSKMQVEVNMVNQIAGQEMELLAYVLPSLHIRTLSLLQKIIQCKIGQAFYGIMGEQLVATLKSTNQMMRVRSKKNEAVGDKEAQKIFQGELVKVMAYKTLATLIQVSEGRHKLPAAALLSIVKCDVEISKETIMLKAVKGGDLSLNLKKKKKGYSVSEEDLKNDCVITNAELSLRVPSAIAALNLIKAMFLHAHHSMQRSLIKGFRDTLLQLMKTSLKGVYIFPDVRISFFKAILSYARYPHPLYPLDYNSVHFAFVLGCNDDSLKVREICREGLSTLSFIMENPQVTKFSDISKMQNQLKLSKEDEKIGDDEAETEADYGIIQNEAETETDDDDTDTEIIEDNVSEGENDGSESDISDDESNIEIRSNEQKVEAIDGPVSIGNGENMESSLEIVSGMADKSLNASGLHVSDEENTLDDDCENEDEIDEPGNETTVTEAEDPSSSSNEQNSCLEDDAVEHETNGKRKKPQLSDEERKTKKFTKDDPNILLEEMMASFVDADPDSN